MFQFPVFYFSEQVRMSEREQRFPKIVLSPREESSRLPPRKLPNGDGGPLMPSRYGFEFRSFGFTFGPASMA